MTAFRKISLPGAVLLLDFVEHPAGLQPSARKAAERALILRLLRDELKDAAIEITHKSNGQPILASRPELFLSLSHSNGWCAVAVSQEEAIGVDVQTFTSRLERGMDYFVNRQEKAVLGTTYTADHLYLVWCAKEAVYKQLEGRIADLREDITVFQIPDLSIIPMEGKLSVLFEGVESRLFFCVDEKKAVVVTS